MGKGLCYNCDEKFLPGIIVRVGSFFCYNTKMMGKNWLYKTLVKYKIKKEHSPPYTSNTNYALTLAQEHHRSFYNYCETYQSQDILH